MLSSIGLADVIKFKALVRYNTILSLHAWKDHALEAIGPSFWSWRNVGVRSIQSTVIDQSQWNNLTNVVKP